MLQIPGAASSVAEGYCITDPAEVNPSVQTGLFLQESGRHASRDRNVGYCITDPTEVKPLFTGSMSVCIEGDKIGTP